MVCIRLSKNETGLHRNSATEICRGLRELFFISKGLLSVKKYIYLPLLSLEEASSGFRFIYDPSLSPEEKLLRRQEYIKPGFDAFKEWVETQHKNILTKGAIGRALHYAVNQLPLIEPFFEDGRIHLDNNAIENKIRPLALGRKNFLFAGSHEGAKRITMMYSFFASCKEADVNPYAWMTDTLNRIGNHPINKISELLPSNFQKL